MLQETSPVVNFDPQKPCCTTCAGQGLLIFVVVSLFQIGTSGLGWEMNRDHPFLANDKKLPVSEKFKAFWIGVHCIIDTACTFIDSSLNYKSSFNWTFLIRTASTFSLLVELKNFVQFLGPLWNHKKLSSFYVFLVENNILIKNLFYN